MMTFEDSGVQRGAPITARDIKWLHWLLTHIQSPNCDVEYTMQSGRPTLTITAPNIDIGQLQELLPDSYKVKASSGDGTADYLDGKVRYSIEIDASSQTMQLVGDVETPSVASVYGKSAAGVRGHQALTQITMVEDVGLDESGDILQRKRSFYAFEPGDPEEGDYEAAVEVVATPAFSPDGGTHAGSVEVTITCPTAGAAIYYTTDGSAPTEASTLYSSPITLTVDQTVLKARAYKAGLTPSNIKSATYTITEGGEFRWLACSDDSELVIYQAGQSHLPTHDYAWIYTGSTYVRAYLDDEVDDTPGSNPCSVQMASDPGSCGGLDYSAFDDDFSNSSFDTCRHVLIEEAGTSVTEGGSGLACLGGVSSSYASAGFQSRCPVAGDFDVTLTYTGLADYNTYAAVLLTVLIGAAEYSIGSGDFSAVGATIKGVFSYASTESPQRAQDETSVVTSGTLRMTRVGTTLTFRANGNTYRSFTVSSADAVVYGSLQRRYHNASVTITGVAFA